MKSPVDFALQFCHASCCGAETQAKACADRSQQDGPVDLQPDFPLFKLKGPEFRIRERAGNA
jgi:hypothetical protein